MNCRKPHPPYHANPLYLLGGEYEAGARAVEDIDCPRIPRVAEWSRDSNVWKIRIKKNI